MAARGIELSPVEHGLEWLRDLLRDITVLLARVAGWTVLAGLAAAWTGL